MYIYKIAVNAQASNLVLILKTKSRELTVYSETKIQYLAFINVRNKTKKKPYLIIFGLQLSACSFWFKVHLNYWNPQYNATWKIRGQQCIYISWNSVKSYYRHCTQSGLSVLATILLCEITLQYWCRYWGYDYIIL